MTLSRETIYRKMRLLAATRDAKMEQQTYKDAYLLTHLIKQHEPITREELKGVSGLGTMRFNRAWKLVKPKIWLVGKGYEMKTETAKL